MQRWQCPILNGNLLKLCLIKYELDVNVHNLINWSFLIGVSLQKDLWVLNSTAGTHRNYHDKML